MDVFGESMRDFTNTVNTKDTIHSKKAENQELQMLVRKEQITETATTVGVRILWNRQHFILVHSFCFLPPPFLRFFCPVYNCCLQINPLSGQSSLCKSDIPLV
jgi:hypothetical protein